MWERGLEVKMLDWRSHSRKGTWVFGDACTQPSSSGTEDREGWRRAWHGSAPHSMHVVWHNHAAVTGFRKQVLLWAGLILISKATSPPGLGPALLKGCKAPLHSVVSSPTNWMCHNHNLLLQPLLHSLCWCSRQSFTAMHIPPQKNVCGSWKPKFELLNSITKTTEKLVHHPWHLWILDHPCSLAAFLSSHQQRFISFQTISPFLSQKGPMWKSHPLEKYSKRKILS